MAPVLPTKNLITMLIAALLFVAGHLYFYTTPVEILRELRLINGSALLALCLFGSLFLFAGAGCNRSRKIFAWEMLIAAMAAVFTLVRLFLPEDSTSALISCGTVTYSSIFAFVLLLYPLELLFPCRITKWGYFRLFSPILITSLLYYGYVLFGGATTTIHNVNDLMANLHRFDVWFRLAIFAYPIWMFGVILLQRSRYVAWGSRNTSTQGSIDLGWLDSYLFGYFLILISCVIVVLFHNAQGFIILSFGALVFFGLTFYDLIKRDMPLTPLRHDRYGEPQIEAPQAQYSLPVRSQAMAVAAARTMEEDKYCFADRLPQYKSDLKVWMETQKPFRNKDFKLLDVMQVLPLNRTYLSRLFNEGYGESFVSFVMRYRLDDSANLLTNYPDLSIRRISEMSGFSSPSVFGRAFLKHMGVTPLQYRRSHMVEV